MSGDRVRAALVGALVALLLLSPLVPGAAALFSAAQGPPIGADLGASHAAVAPGVAASIFRPVTSPPASIPSSTPSPATSPTPSPTRAPLLLSGWSNLTTTEGPSVRSGAAMAYDVRNGSVLLFGGTSPTQGPLNDTWSFAQGSWKNLTASLTGAPPAGGANLLADDAADGYLLLYQGSSGSSWTYSGERWTPVAGPGPSARWHAAMAYDNSTRSVVLFGGAFGGSTPTNETWEFSQGVWKNATGSVGTAPSARWGAEMTYDPTVSPSGGLRLFGGYNGSFLNDTWTFAAGHWSLTDPPGPGVAGRWGATFLYDPSDRAVLLFGGTGATGPTNDTWLYTPSSWTEIPLLTSPPTRSEEGSAVDAWSGLPLLFGGLVGSNARNDTWAWGGLAGGAALSVADLASPEAIDLGQTFTITTSTLGGALPYTYTWRGLPPGCSAGNVATLTCKPSTSGAWLLELTVVDGGGSVASALPLLLDSAPTLAIASFSAVPTSVDVGQSTLIQTSPKGGTLPWSFSYSGLPPGCLSANTANLTCTPTAGGNVSVVVTVRDGAGASKVASTSLAVANVTPPSVALSGPLGPVLVGATVNVTSAVSGGVQPFHFSWTVNGLAVAGAGASLPFSPPAAGTYTVNVSVVDSIGRSAQATTSVVATVPAVPLAASLVSSAISIPSGGSVMLTASASGGAQPYSYRWSLNGQNSTGGGPSWTVLLVGPATDTVRVWVSDAHGALVGSNAVTVTVGAPPASSPASPGLSLSEGELVVGALAAVGILVLIVGVVRRFGRRPKAAPGGTKGSKAEGASSEPAPASSSETAPGPTTSPSVEAAPPTPSPSTSTGATSGTEPSLPPLPQASAPSSTAVEPSPGGRSP